MNIIHTYTYVFNWIIKLLMFDIANDVESYFNKINVYQDRNNDNQDMQGGVGWLLK